MNLANSEYHHIWNVLKALMEQDADLADVVKNIGRIGNQKTGEHITELDKYVHINTDSQMLYDLINVKILNNLVSVWDTRYAMLVAFKEQHGDINVPKKTWELYRWCQHQRSYLRDNRLPPEKAAKLRALGMQDAGIKDLEGLWDTRFQECKDYAKQTKKTFNLPDSDPNIRLVNWQSTQREEFNSGTISQRRRKKLESVGFIFNMIEYKWNDKYKRLLAGEKSSAIKTWLHRQKDYNLQGTLAENKKQLLIDAGVNLYKNKTTPFDFVRKSCR